LAAASSLECTQEQSCVRQQAESPALCSGQACFAGRAASSKLTTRQDCLFFVPQANT